MIDFSILFSIVYSDYPENKKNQILLILKHWDKASSRLQLKCRKMIEECKSSKFNMIRKL